MYLPAEVLLLKGTKAMNNYYAHPSSYIDEPCNIGNGVRIWHFCHIMPNCVIGENCNIGQNVMIGKGVLLGNNVKVQNNVSVYEGITCEDNVFIGPSVVFTNVVNPRSAISRKHEFKQTLIRQGATIGANATILCGIIVGEYAFIGAGAVVTKSVPAYALVTGNPAKQTGWMSEHGYKLSFTGESIAICQATGDMYVLESGVVQKREKKK